jgi:uncharacterized ferritin-like protein (DUF455 family)
MLAAHLQVLGHAYGDFPAHDSLWEMVDKTRGDVVARMALVPRTLEARGLDAIPPLRAKLAQARDLAAAKILDRILHDEIGHVEIGNRWYRYLCEQRGLEPRATYAELAARYRRRLRAIQHRKRAAWQASRNGAEVFRLEHRPSRVTPFFFRLFRLRATTGLAYSTVTNCLTSSGRN